MYIAVWSKIRKPVPLSFSVRSLLNMSNSSLADRFQVIQNTQSQNAQTDRLMTMSYEELGMLPIRFGDSKVGQKFQDVVKEDQKYCQSFIRKFSASSKPEHREFIHYLNMYVERKELELNLPNPVNPEEKNKEPPKTKAGLARGNQSGAPSMIDLDLEEEAWD